MNQDYKTVLKFSKKYNVIPVYKEILADLETPLSAYLKIDNPQNSFLLESVEGGERAARYSFLGRDPFEIFTYKNGIVTRQTKGKNVKIKTNDPFKELTNIFKKFKTAPVRELPGFQGGAVGYVGYDAVKLYEKVPNKEKLDMLGWPDIYFMFADILMVFDHIAHKIYIIKNIFVKKNDTAASIKRKYNNTVKKLNEIVCGMKKTHKKKEMKKHKGVKKMKCYTSRKKFESTVRSMTKMIQNGEAIQIVASQRFGVKYDGDPLNVYRSLRIINPSPYMHYIRMGDKIIIGASPELMVQTEKKVIRLRPIAGTVKRGKTEKKDKELMKKLLNDEKERAEHIMLVDLGRNDIGRVAENGSVEVESIMTIEKYSHVMHIVSSVKGKMKKGKNVFDVFKSTFPAGTVSGAPKVRAMQIIDEMEEIKRGPYAGAVGYISFSGNINTCISIRTIYYNKGMLYIQSGAGIVSDSKPEKEYIETINKAKAAFKAIEKADKLGE